MYQHVGSVTTHSNLFIFIPKNTSNDLIFRAFGKKTLYISCTPVSTKLSQLNYVFYTTSSNAYKQLFFWLVSRTYSIKYIQKSVTKQQQQLEQFSSNKTIFWMHLPGQERHCSILPWLWGQKTAP